MGKIITVFSHKGGVGKTTLVHNVGSLLANMGKRVLLIDADPQMNLTALMSGFSIDADYDSDSQCWLDFLERHTNLAEFLETSYNSNMSPSVFTKTTIDVERSFSDGGSVSLIPSAMMGNSVHASIPDLEFNLNSVLLNPTLIANRNVPINICNSLKELAKNYDFVLIDTAPNATSAVTSLLFFSSDFFLVPVRPDFFSLQAVGNLTDITSNWRQLFNPWLSTRNSKGLNFPLFLGVVPQMTKRFKNRNSDFARHARQWNTAINSAIVTFLADYAPSTHLRTVPATEAWFSQLYPESQPFVIKECVHFTDKLRTIAEKASVPVVFLTNNLCARFGEDLVKIESEDTDNQYKKAYQYIREEYQYIADGLLRL